VTGRDPVPLAALLREMCDEALTRAAALRAGARSAHLAEQITAEAAELTARIHCVHCQGDLDAADWWLTIGEGRCTCLVRCAKPWCLQAAPALSPPDTPEGLT
jgi:hypothetical protein